MKRGYHHHQWRLLRRKKRPLLSLQGSLRLIPQWMIIQIDSMRVHRLHQQVNSPVNPEHHTVPCQRLITSHQQLMKILSFLSWQSQKCQTRDTLLLSVRRGRATTHSSLILHRTNHSLKAQPRMSNQPRDICRVKIQLQNHLKRNVLRLLSKHDHCLHQPLSSHYLENKGSQYEVERRMAQRLFLHQRCVLKKGLYMMLIRNSVSNNNGKIK